MSGCLYFLRYWAIAIGFNKVVKKFTKICLRPERAPLKIHTFLFWHNTLYQIWCVTASIVVFKLTCGKLVEAHQWWLTVLDFTNYLYDFNYKGKKIQVIKLNSIDLVNYPKRWLVEKRLKQINYLTNFEGKGPWLIKICYYLFIL